MPRIRIIQAVAGHDFSWIPGQELDLPAEEAAKWADGVRAAYVEQAVERPAKPAAADRKRAVKGEAREKRA